jgi:hypothetical protein
MTATFTIKKGFILQIPYNAKTYELTNSVVWFDESGILYSRPKELITDVGVDQVKEEMKRFREILMPHKQVCMIAEAHPGGTKLPKKGDRDMMADEVASVTKAMAVIISSSVSKMIINLFFAFKPPPYPMRMFNDEASAKNWIRQYL